MKQMRAAVTFLVVAAWMAAPAAHATQTMIRHAAVEWLLAVDANTGRCFAKLDKSVSTAGSAVVNCESDSVALACGSDSNGVRTFDLAMLAFQTNRLVNVRVTDQAKVGGSCLATHVYVTRYRAGCRYRGSSDYDDDYYDHHDDYDDRCEYDDRDDDDDDRDDDDDD